jgi:hypothetical protein
MDESTWIRTFASLARKVAKYLVDVGAACAEVNSTATESSRRLRGWFVPE